LYSYNIRKICEQPNRMWPQWVMWHGHLQNVKDA